MSTQHAAGSDSATQNTLALSLDGFLKARWLGCRLPDEDQHKFREGLRTIMVTSNGIGWGYHDGLCEEYCEGFPEDE